MKGEWGGKRERWKRGRKKERREWGRGKGKEGMRKEEGKVWNENGS